jgi:hypothetical protein
MDDNTPNQESADASRRNLDWARLALLRMLVVLAEGIRLKRPIPPEPWGDGDTRPGVRRGDQ